MSTIKCPECGADVSNKLSKCSSCGFPLKKKAPKITIMVSVCIAGLAILFGCLILFKNNRAISENGSIADNGLFDFLDSDRSAHPIPFSDANWSTSAEDLVEMLGQPDEEYDNEYYGHGYVYKNVKNDGYTGEAKYFYENGSLTRVFFMIDGYDTSAIAHFKQLFADQYGSPTYTDEYQNERWDTEVASYGVSSSRVLGGFVDIAYFAPSVVEGD